MIVETTCSLSVGTGVEVKLGAMPVATRGRRRRQRATPKTEAMWKELTVAVFPWKKAKGLSAYQVANAYMGADSMEFCEGLMEEAVAVCAQRVINHVKPQADKEYAIYTQVETVFEDWKLKTVVSIAEQALAVLNARLEIVVLEMHCVAEGMDTDFDGTPAPALKLEGQDIMINPAYEPLFSAFSPELHEAVNQCFDLFEDTRELRTHDLGDAVDKIAQAFCVTS